MFSSYFGSILFRDLKPENVAQHHHQQAMQLFDFGLAKELKAIDKLSPHEYRMTGLTGTLRIMAPEVIQCQPYGFAADVYSFGIVLWEVFSGERNMLTAMEVCKQKRPRIPQYGMPDDLRKLLQECWSDDASKRPTMDAISKFLQAQLSEIELRTTADSGSENADPSNSSPLSILVSIAKRTDILRQLSIESKEESMEE